MILPTAPGQKRHLHAAPSAVNVYDAIFEPEYVSIGAVTINGGQGLLLSGESRRRRKHLGC